MKTNHTIHQTIDPLEYAAILSGMAMAGDTVSDNDIEFARHLHTQNKDKIFSFSSYLGATRR